MGNVAEPKIGRITAVDWTGQKRVTVTGDLLTQAVSVGEVAEAVREKIGLPRGSYSVYYRDQKLDRTATLGEAEITEDSELELSPEVKAAR